MSQVNEIPYHVFLDTQVFYAVNFDWTAPTIKSLKERVRRGSIQLITTDIVSRELKKGIAEKHQQFQKTLLRVSKATAFARCLEDERIANLETFSLEGLSLEALEKATNKFLIDTKTTVLPIPERSAIELFDLYFAGAPPFGDKKKKSEFPDAANMLALVDYARTNACEIIHVVSGDPDWQAVCKTHRALVWVKHLSEITDKAIRAEWIADELWSEHELLGLLNSHHAELTTAITFALETATKVNAGDGVLEHFAVTTVSLDGLALTEVNLRHDTLKFYGELFHNVSYSAEVSLFDELMRSELEETIIGTTPLTASICLEVNKQNLSNLRIVSIDYEEGLYLEMALEF
jgi:rRNA-processing protein FCF1